MPNYTFCCDACGSTLIEHYKIDARPDGIGCPCGGIAHFRISAPNVVGKESYLDGHKRKGWADLREASKLNVEAASSKPERKKEISKEIRKLGVGVSK